MLLSAIGKYDNKLTNLRLFFKPIFSLYIILLLCLYFLFHVIYTFHAAELKNNLKNEARHISNTLQEIFDLASQLVIYLSKQIAVASTDDLNTIIKIIGKDKDIEENDSLSWMNLGWINSKNMFVFDRNAGLINPPYDLSHRPYVQDCVKRQWKFYMSQVVIGASVGIRKIPGGIGISDSKGRYLGTLCAGFRLVDLNYKVQQKLSMANFSDTNVSYVVVDKDLHIVLQSPDNEIDIESAYYKDILETSNVFLNDEGILLAPIECKSITYTHYKKVKNFPYYVLTGVNHKVSKFYFLWRLSPFIIGFLIMGVGCAILIFSNRKQLLKYTELSEQAKVNFLKRTKTEMKVPLNNILTYCEILSKNLKGEIDIGITIEKQKRLIDKIYEAALNLSDLTTNTLEFSCIEVNVVIQECVLIHSQAALIRGIKIKTSLCPHLPPLIADELRFKQAIIGLISLSLEYSPKGSLIKVSTAFKSLNDQNFFELVIEDNGFALNEEAIRRIHEKLEGVNNGDGINFEFTAIEKLIKMHGGTLHLESEWQQGKKITVVFPYKKLDQNSDKSEETKKNNVHNMFNKEHIN